MVHTLTVARAADALDVAWHTANDAVIAEGRRVLISDPARFDGVTVLGVDEHVWRHTRRGDTDVTVIIDLTPVRNRTGTARLMDRTSGRSKAVFKDWLAARPEHWRKNVEVVAMDGFSAATAVLDPFHVVRLAADALDRCRRRVQQQLHGHRGRSGDPLSTARRTLSTGDDLLTQKQCARLETLFAVEAHVEVEATRGIDQRMITASRDHDRTRRKAAIEAVITAVAEQDPTQLVELRRLDRTLKQRAADVIACFDRPHTSNRPTEAINARLEHLRDSALGFRNLTNYTARSLLAAGGLRPRRHPHMR